MGANKRGEAKDAPLSDAVVARRVPQGTRALSFRLCGHLLALPMPT